MSIQLKALITTTGIILAFLAGCLFVSYQKTPVSEVKPLGTINSFRQINHSTSSVPTTSTLIQATSTARGYARITNASSSVVWIALGEAAVVNKGIALQQYGSYEIKVDNLFTGAIYAISTSGTATVAVINEIQ